MRDSVLDKVDFPKLLEQIGFADVDPAAQKYLGFCLFHPDNATKSFGADLQEGWFRCFGCGIKGNAIKLYSLWKRMDYDKAREELKDLPTIRSVARLESQLKVAVTVPTHRRMQILTDFVSSLPMVTATPYKDYLNARGLSDKTLNDYGIRGLWLHASVVGELTKFSERYPIEELEAVGLATAQDSGYHKLNFIHHPIIFPYYLGTSVVFLQGRMAVPGDKADLKYLSLSGKITHAFNHDAFQTAQDALYVCEGAMDALSMVELGYGPPVGVPGVNNFKESWLDGLRCNKVVLAFDNDAAGLSAYGRVAAMLAKRHMTAWHFKLPDGVKDINNFLILKRSADKV